MKPPQVVPVNPNDPSALALGPAADLLRAGGLVAFPTETVYGLGADARDDAAVRRIFAAKGRPADNPLIVHVAGVDEAAAVASAMPPLAADLAARWWPGPLTIVLEADPSLPRATTGGLSTVAVRVPAHPVALALLREAAIPVAAPSANRSGRPSPTTARHVVDDLRGAVGIVLDAGPCPVGVESTVVDARGDRPVVLREGAITREDLGLTGSDDADAAHEGSPGTRYRHYAPVCRVEIAPPGEAVALAAALAAAGLRTGLIGFSPAPDGVVAVAVVGDLESMARSLYGALRDAEDAGVEVVVVEAVAEVGLGRAVMDRLRRAARAAG